MALDKNPRTFFLEVTAIEANVDASEKADNIVIEFAGRVPPSVRERLGKAFADGRFDMIDKRLV